LLPHPASSHSSQRMPSILPPYRSPYRSVICEARLALCDNVPMNTVRAGEQVLHVDGAQYRRRTLSPGLGAPGSGAAQTTG
jgi:hypothetical protein